MVDLLRDEHVATWDRMSPEDETLAVHWVHRASQTRSDWHISREPYPQVRWLDPQKTHPNHLLRRWLARVLTYMIPPLLRPFPGSTPVDVPGPTSSRRGALHGSTCVGRGLPQRIGPLTGQGCRGHGQPIYEKAPRGCHEHPWTLEK